MTLQNNPELWLSELPVKSGDHHKYDYGHVCVYGAPVLTGATRLAAESCARIGAGLVTVVSDGKGDVFRASLPAHIMVQDDPLWFAESVTAVIYGPGGLSQRVRIRPGIKTVLDASALNDLPEILNENVVLTPHDGEFAKAFPEITGARVEQALKAARKTGAVVVLKGAKTIIAHPDGREVHNMHTSPHLATAGTGDALAGMIAGLMALGMAPFSASCAAVWLHGECGRRGGPGFVASDLPGLIPRVLQDLLGFGPQLG